MPVAALFEHIDQGSATDEFLERFPSVRPEQAPEALAFTKGLSNSRRRLREEGGFGIGVAAGRRAARRRWRRRALRRWLGLPYVLNQKPRRR